MYKIATQSIVLYQNHQHSIICLTVQYSIPFSPGRVHALYRIHHHCNQHALYGLLLSGKVWCVQHFSQWEWYVMCYVASFCWEQSVPKLCHHRHLVLLQTALPTVWPTFPTCSLSPQNILASTMHRHHFRLLTLQNSHSRWKRRKTHMSSLADTNFRSDHSLASPPAPKLHSPL